MRDFNDLERLAVYRAIALRRDIRRQFTPAPVPPDVLVRLLTAAHRAGSVGFMQPWDFILVRDPGVRRRVLESFLRERDRAARLYDGPRRELFLSLKLEGILESALNLCVTCDRSRGGPHVLGRSTILDTDLYSTCCAIQNLWLAARVEGIGVGWVSILDPAELAALLGLPDAVVPVAYLCLGYVERFPEEPELQSAGWRRRLPLARLVHLDRWGGDPEPEMVELLERGGAWPTPAESGVAR
jgi:5,6-dimethylbenzimidazole synthase